MRRVVHQRGPARLTANLTPMIDLTFLLIVFFVLVAQITETERVTLDLPQPEDPASVLPTEEMRAVLNLVPLADDRSRVESLRVGGASFPADADGRSQLTAHLASLYRDNPTLRLNLRADRMAEYREIEPILAAVTEAAGRVGVAPRVNLVVVRDP